MVSSSSSWFVRTFVCSGPVCAQAITLMIIYDWGHKRVPDGIDLFTPEGSSRDSTSAPHRAGSRTGGRGRPVLFSTSSPSHWLLPVVYFSPVKLRFLTSSFAAATPRRLRGRLRLNSGIYELHRTLGWNHFRRRAGWRVCMCVCVCG